MGARGHGARGAAAALAALIVACGSPTAWAETPAPKPVGDGGCSASPTPPDLNELNRAVDQARKGLDDAQRSVHESQAAVRLGESDLKEALATQTSEQSKYDYAVKIAEGARARWDAAVARHDTAEWIEQAHQDYLSAYSTARLDAANAHKAESRAGLAAEQLKDDKDLLAQRERRLAEATARLAKAEKALSDANAGSKTEAPCPQKKSKMVPSKKTQAPPKPPTKVCPKGTGLAGKVDDIACQDSL